jgi:copper-containing nitrite reductase
MKKTAILLSLLGALIPCHAESEVKAEAAIKLPPEIRGEEIAVLTDPPNVPPPIKRKHPTKFRVLNPGLYIYHCAVAPVGMHVANGMYGLIYVEPEGGLPKVDREFYVVQGDFYTKGRNGEQGLQPFDMEKAIDERPDYVVFNGSVGAMTGDKAVTAEKGETVRVFFGNGGPNLSSSFHVIGEIFDKVYVEGGTRTINENVQTTMVPAGGSAILEFKCEVPGTLILVDHALTRAFNKGAIGTILHGLTGEVTVNGNKYNSVMPALALHDEDVANVMTFVLNSWDNQGGEVKPADVAKVRAGTVKK